jgi:hypothetical protein
VSADDVIARIVEQNLGVYRVSPSRLQEDVSQEAQVASDYRGRLVYELLQNADDAMADMSGTGDRVAFLVTDDEVWIANTGRPLTEDDVHGLCGLGASSKIDSSGHRRASIGHKGLGFKSVLEVTDEPTVYSRTYSFQLGARHARTEVEALWAQLGRAAPRSVPAMRFPVPVAESHPRWAAYAAEGFNTAFRFPFRPGLDPEARVAVAELLLGLPLTTVLFLKHLETVEVRVEQRGQEASRTWIVERERRHEPEGTWTASSGFRGSGVYRVSVAGDDAGATFVVAHDADVPIGGNRVGLSGPAWEGVGLTEVSVAALEPGSGELPSEWRHFHVFLPTSEPCPYPILVNGAFSTDLSRQHVRVSPEAGDYNSHLLRIAARLVVTELLRILGRAGTEAALRALDRGNRTAEDAHTAAALLHAGITQELAGVPLLPSEPGQELTLQEAVLPPAVLGDAGVEFREALPEDPVWEGRRFPAAPFCAGRWARIAADHGARELRPAESLGVLAALHDPARSASVDDESGGFELDPLLELCATLWHRTAGEDRSELERRSRSERLFPIRRRDDRTLERVALGDDTAFYPPRSARQDLPLRGLRFMCHAVCWGALSQNERLTLLDERMKAWTSLFDVREFRFETVVQAAVLPALVLHPDAAAGELLETLRDRRALAAVCQLAGRFAKPDRPLRYQRLQSDRALLNLSRLPVPCRAPDGGVTWCPAYRVYFGADWIGEQSVEHIARAIPQDDPATTQIELSWLAPPEYLEGLLDAPSHAEATGAGDAGDDEVDADEDADEAIETNERDRWIAFLSWIGVNRALRPVHFHDVEDDATGWLTTRDLAQPRGWAFERLGETWTTFAASLRARVASRKDAAEKTPYLYDAHDLDQIVPLLAATERDANGTLARALLEHLVRHWPFYAGFADCRLALVDRDKSPNQRAKPQRALAEELTTAGDNLWLHRLRRRAVCPTSHGPRPPGVTWQRSAELERRFARRNREAGELLPVLTLPDGLPANAVHAVAERLGVRAEPSPSTFEIEDALLLCARLELLYARDGTGVDEALLREIKPVYRQLFELLSGRSAAASDEPPLRRARLLADTVDGLRFSDADDILYAGTPGMRERSGVAGTVPTFVLEAEPAAAPPLARLFGVRTLEDALVWHPDPGEPPFAADALGELRAGMRDLLVPLLARIRIERHNARDAEILAAVLDRVQPVQELTLTCTLDGVRLDRVAQRPYFVDASAPEGVRAYIVWDESRAWPPPPEAAQGLAMALADSLGVNLVETFLAFIQSEPEHRRRLLDIAGASAMLDEVEAELAETDGTAVSPQPDSAAVGPTPAPGSGGAEEAAQPPAPSKPAAPPVPLLRFEDLTIEGEPILIAGEPPSGAGREAGRRAPGGNGDARGAGPRAPAGTDLGALDALGMRVAIAYEVHRLRRSGRSAARTLRPGDEQTDATSLVVDVHTPEAIRAAEHASPTARAVLADLEREGVSRLFPGFDLLVIADAAAERLIELKSSGVDAYVQAMSWNEWKTARASHIRGRFWLYLVGKPSTRHRNRCAVRPRHPRPLREPRRRRDPRPPRAPGRPAPRAGVLRGRTPQPRNSRAELTTAAARLRKPARGVLSSLMRPPRAHRAVARPDHPPPPAPRRESENHRTTSCSRVTGGAAQKLYLELGTKRRALGLQPFPLECECPPHARGTGVRLPLNQAATCWTTATAGSVDSSNSVCARSSTVRNSASLWRTATSESNRNVARPVARTAHAVCTKKVSQNPLSVINFPRP